MILDAGWASLASVDAAQTAAFSRAHDAAAAHIRIDNSTTTIRALRVTGQDGRAWIFAANFGGQPATLSAAQLGLANKTGGIPSIVLDAGHARLLAA